MKRIATGLSLWSLIRTVRSKDIQQRAERTFRLGLVGNAEVTEALARALAGPTWEDLERQGLLVRSEPPVSAETFATFTTAVFTLTGPLDVEPFLALLNAPQVPVPTLVLERSAEQPVGQVPAQLKRDPFVKRAKVRSFSDAQAMEALAQLVAITPEYRLAMGRRIPALRKPIARQIVLETSRANAEVSALSNIPDVIPIIGNFIGTSAEFLILTRTQIAMVYILAALHGRDIRRQSEVLKEIVPVIGTAFVWRTVARELASMVPLFLGAIPKILIAYTGTLVLGQTAAYYYDEGRRPPKEIVQSYYNTAVDRAKSSRLPVVGVKGAMGEPSPSSASET